MHQAPRDNGTGKFKSEEGVWPMNMVAIAGAAELPQVGCESRAVTLCASCWVIWACDSRQTKL